MTDQISTQAKDMAAEPVRFRAIGVASLVMLVALAVTGDLDRRWPATAGVLTLGVISAGIVAWRGRRRDRAETRAAKVSEVVAIVAAVSALAFALWSHPDLWDAMIRASYMISGPP